MILALLLGYEETLYGLPGT